MTTFFKELFEYNNHFNQLLIAELFKNSDKTPEKAIYLQNHIINAHQIWNSRLVKEVPFEVFQINPIVELQNLDKRNHERSMEIIDTLNLSETIKYTNTKGQTFTNSVRDILFHVINHSTYHRAQIATLFKQNGMTPLATDYIFYKRNELK